MYHLLQFEKLKIKTRLMAFLTPDTTRHIRRRAVPRPKRHPQNFTNFAGPDWGGIIIRGLL